MRALLVSTVLMCAVGRVNAKIVTEAVPYQDGSTALEGYVAYDDAQAGPRPGVLVVHEWWGLNDFAKEQARRLAELGYVGFALDMYGKGVVTSDPAEATKLSGQFKENPKLFVERATAGLKALAANSHVNPHQIAAIGFCFGGTTVLSLAYSGADVAGVVSFHGGLIPPPEGCKPFKARILVLHGSADTHVPPDKVAAFEDGVSKLGADWQLIVYSGAKHSFTNPASSKLNMEGIGYQEAAARRSWEHMKLFLHDLFEPSPTTPPAHKP